MRRGVKLVLHDVVDDADLDPPAQEEGDRDREMRDAAGEIGRAVDRVDDPGRVPVPAALLAEEVVARANRGEPAADVLLDPASVAVRKS